MRATVESELGRPLEDVFSSFDRAPLAAASIAQVHAATLHTGERVVVKVQRTTVAELVTKDLGSWRGSHRSSSVACPFAALANPPALVELFAETITEELDFRLEAQNMLDVAKSFVDLGQRGLHHPEAPPHPRHPTGAGDGAPRRLQLRRRGLA